MALSVQPGDQVDVRVEVVEVRRRPDKPTDLILVRSVVQVEAAAAVDARFLVEPAQVVRVARRTR